MNGDGGCASRRFSFFLLFLPSFLTSHFLSPYSDRSSCHGQCRTPQTISSSSGTTRRRWTSGRKSNCRNCNWKTTTPTTAPRNTPRVRRRRPHLSPLADPRIALGFERARRPICSDQSAIVRHLLCLGSTELAHEIRQGRAGMTNIGRRLRPPTFPLRSDGTVDG